MRRLCVALLLALLTAAGVRAEDGPFPAGVSSHELSGLKCSIVMPKEFDAAAEHSMVVILHGAGGTETGMAHALMFLAEQGGYVIVAPKSRGQVWEKQDLDDVKTIVTDLKARLNVGETRLHGVGFSNGGWNLTPIVFDPDLHFTSACWVAAGYQGGKPPKHAKKGMGILALAGAEDANRSAAESTPKALEGKVRSGEVRIQPNLGHKWPRELMPYYGYWLGVQEGRFVPGETLSFEWTDAEVSADTPPPTDGKSGAFVYWYSADQADDEQALTLQNVVFHDPLVRHYGKRLTAVKRDAAEADATLAALRIKKLPAVVTYDAKGAVKKVLQGKITAKSLSSALRSVAKNKKKPGK